MSADKGDLLLENLVLQLLELLKASEFDLLLDEELDVDC